VSQVQRNAHTSSITSTVVPFPDGRQTILVKALPDASARDIRTALDLIPPAVVAPKAITLIVGGTDLQRCAQRLSFHLALPTGEIDTLLVSRHLSFLVATVLAVLRSKKRLRWHRARHGSAAAVHRRYSAARS